MGFSSSPLLVLLSLFLFAFGTVMPLPVSDPHWHPSTATWYGSAEGDGSDGGACGYGSLVDVRPYRARVTSVSPVLFRNGEGCGACYRVRCVDPLCSHRGATVIVTDEGPGGYRAFDSTHFDLSGAAFGHMATVGNAARLRSRGKIFVMYQRYEGLHIAFRVNAGSSDFYISLSVEFEDGDGDIGSMHIKQSGSSEWLEMNHVSGITWCINRGPLKGPFSMKLTTLSTKNTLQAWDVIPKNWSPKATYTSRLNFL